MNINSVRFGNQFAQQPGPAQIDTDADRRMMAQEILGALKPEINTAIDTLRRNLVNPPSTSNFTEAGLIQHSIQTTAAAGILGSVVNLVG